MGSAFNQTGVNMAATANFSNQAHNYNISANHTPTNNGPSPPSVVNNPGISGGGATGIGGLDIPFMYFTPREAIKLKKAKQKHNNIGVILQQ